MPKTNTHHLRLTSISALIAGIVIMASSGPRHTQAQLSGQGSDVIHTAATDLVIEPVTQTIQTAHATMQRTSTTSLLILGMLFLVLGFVIHGLTLQQKQPKRRRKTVKRIQRSVKLKHLRLRHA